MIDVHAHLEDEAFERELDLVIERARKAGVRAIVTSVIYPEDLERAVEIVERFHGYVFLSIGLDPAVVDEEKFLQQQEAVRRYASRIVAVGEVGLDYYYVRDREDRARQEKMFREWIRVARDYGLPLVVHSRSAGKYAVQVLFDEEFYDAVMHAYDGSVGWAMDAASRGVKFSIPPSVWFSTQKQKLVRRLPLDSMLLESDSPVLSPRRGERNEPANIVYSVKKIAELKRVSEREVAETALEVTLRLFKRLSTFIS